MRQSMIGAPALAVAVLLGTVGAAPVAHSHRIHRVLLVSIDGLRPDLLLRANTPTLRELMRQGSFSMWARTTAASVTLPSHTSMLTGCRPARHGVDWNRDLPFADPVYPKCPTLFEVAKQAGLTTAMVAGKKKFQTLARPGSLDWSFVPPLPVVSDEVVVGKALDVIARHRPDVLFVHLPGVDTAGHAEGWGSPAQIAAIEAADRSIGRLLAAIRAQGALDGTLVLVSSDHGGAGKDHGPDDPRSRTIPWIIAGPGIRRGVDLTLDRDLEIDTEDTFATICYLMDIPVPETIDGHPVLQVTATPGPPTPTRPRR